MSYTNTKAEAIWQLFVGILGSIAGTVFFSVVAYKAWETSELGEKVLLFCILAACLIVLYLCISLLRDILGKAKT